MSFFETVIGAIKRFVHARRDMSMEEVNEMLTARAIEREEKTKEHLDWQTSIIDLMKLCDEDSSLQARRSLAEELGFQGVFIGTAEQNTALHKLVMDAVAKRCISIPKG